MTVTFRLRTNWKLIDAELDRLDRVPAKAHAMFEGILQGGFKATQAVVHVQTGSLKSSGKVSSKVEGDTWKGSISYGGVSLGINNPVTYAIYEKARDVGKAGGVSNAKGDHDFMRPLQALDPMFTKALLKALS